MIDNLLGRFEKFSTVKRFKRGTYRIFCMQTANIDALLSIPPAITDSYAGITSALLILQLLSSAYCTSAD